MSQTVLTFSAAQLEALRTYYAPHAEDSTPPGSLFRARTPSCTITAYRSGKVLFQGEEHSREASKWEKLARKKDEKEGKRASHGYEPPAKIGQMSVVGSDEVGTGDYFGPIVVCSVYVARQEIDTIKKLGVRDSKKLTDARIVQIARAILPRLTYSLLICDNRKYNELISRGWTQGKIKAVLHNRAITNVLEKLHAKKEKPDAILIDEFTAPQQYFRHLQKENEVLDKNVYFITGAESVHPAVASASILARYAFLNKMAEIEKEAKMKLPLGAGPAVDEACSRILERYGERPLRNWAKVHFSNTKKAKRRTKS